MVFGASIVSISLALSSVQHFGGFYSLAFVPHEFGLLAVWIYDFVSFFLQENYEVRFPHFVIVGKLANANTTVFDQMNDEMNKKRLLSEFVCCLGCEIRLFRKRNIDRVFSGSTKMRKSP